MRGATPPAKKDRGGDFIFGAMIINVKYYVNLSIHRRFIVACRSINLRMVNVAVWSMFEAPLPKSFKIHEILAETGSSNKQSWD